MSAARRALLSLSESSWLRRHAPRWWFVRKAAARFMPGDTLDAALMAAHTLQREGLAAVLTQLGENVTDAAGAAAVRHHYEDVLARIRDDRMTALKGCATETHVDLSVKPTQLGLDVDIEKCHENLRAIVERAFRQGTRVWIDMEQNTYVDRTLALYRRLLPDFPNVGVCLQAYLYRTKEDLQSLVPLGGGIRLVKGAYREAATVAYPKKSDVDAAFLALAHQMLDAARHASSARPVFGTHDRNILDAIAREAHRLGLAHDAFEFHLLFGIQREEQLRLAREGYRVRVLISYGDQWFAWYMRRLAERPANVWFALRAMFS